MALGQTTTDPHAAQAGQKGGGNKYRALTQQGLKSEEIAGVVSRIVFCRGKLKTSKSDNGDEFIGNAMSR